MAAGFTLAFSEAATNTNALTVDTTGSFTPALGDVALVVLANAADLFGLALSGGGVTWSKQGAALVPSTYNHIIYRATAGTPSSGVLTIDSDFDEFDAYNVQVVRPVDLVWVGEVGRNSSAAADPLTVTLTTASPAALLGLGGTVNNVTFTVDSGWTTLNDEFDASAPCSTSQYRLSDDSQWLVDLSSSNAVAGLVFEFSAAATATASLTESKLLKSPLLHSLLVR